MLVFVCDASQAQQFTGNSKKKKSQSELTHEACWKETESPRMCKRTRKQFKLCGGSAAWRAANIRCSVDSTLWLGERRIDVMWITYPEASQVLHLTDALNTLGIHKGGGSRGGQPDAFNYVPKNG